MRISVVISARNEFPAVVHTVHSIINDLEAFLRPTEFEIVLVDNLSDDEHPIQRSLGGTLDFLRVRSAGASGILKFLYDPIAGNVSARNKGAAIARGEYLFFSDAHMSYRPGAFQRMVEAIGESGGIVHPAIAWMGSCPPEAVYQYSWRLGDAFEGTWNERCVASEWFYVPASGHCCLGLRREQFFDYHGYPDHLRCYGGGGMFLDTKWWMFGSSVVTEPRAIAYHLSSARGYSASERDYIHNMFHSALILGADSWAERVYLHHHQNMPQEILDTLWREAEAEAQNHRLFVHHRAQMTFEHLLVRKPWDTLNDARFGTHSPSISGLGQGGPSTQALHAQRSALGSRR